MKKKTVYLLLSLLIVSTFMLSSSKVPKTGNTLDLVVYKWQNIESQISEMHCNGMSERFFLYEDDEYYGLQIYYKANPNEQGLGIPLIPLHAPNEYVITITDPTWKDIAWCNCLIENDPTGTFEIR